MKARSRFFCFLFHRAYRYSVVVFDYYKRAELRTWCLPCQEYR